jgi:hypothetical protein
MDAMDRFRQNLEAIVIEGQQAADLLQQVKST